MVLFGPSMKIALHTIDVEVCFFPHRLNEALYAYVTILCLPQYTCMHYIEVKVCFIPASPHKVSMAELIKGSRTSKNKCKWVISVKDCQGKANQSVPPNVCTSYAHS